MQSACRVEGDLQVERSTSRDEGVNLSLEHTSKRVDGYQDTSDIRIDFPILPPFREILVHSFVRDGREQCHVGYADLFLLETFFPIRLCTSSLSGKRARNMDTTYLRDFVVPSRFLGCGRGLLACLLGDSLSIDRVNGEVEKWKDRDKTDHPE